MSDDVRDYSETLFLPKTDFPMRGSLPSHEPARLEKWESEDIYGQLRTDASDAVQLSLFAPAAPDPMLAELASLDLAHLTPLEALNILAKW